MGADLRRATGPTERRRAATQASGRGSLYLPSVPCFTDVARDANASRLHETSRRPPTPRRTSRGTDPPRPMGIAADLSIVVVAGLAGGSSLTCCGNRWSSATCVAGILLGPRADQHHQRPRQPGTARRDRRHPAALRPGPRAVAQGDAAGAPRRAGRHGHPDGGVHGLGIGFGRWLGLAWVPAVWLGALVSISSTIVVHQDPAGAGAHRHAVQPRHARHAGRAGPRGRAADDRPAAALASPDAGFATVAISAGKAASSSRPSPRSARGCSRGSSNASRAAARASCSCWSSPASRSASAT